MNFKPYMYGSYRVTVESDHKPLQFIYQKPLHSVPKHLHRMLLRLQKYSLYIHYKKAKYIYLADTLSRVYLPEVIACDLIPELEEIDHRKYLAVSEELWQQIIHASADDAVLRNSHWLLVMAQSQNLIC